MPECPSAPFCPVIFPEGGRPAQFVTAIQVLPPKKSQYTQETYHCWRNWAIAHKLPVFLASACHIVLYLQGVSNRLQLKSAVEEAVHALTWVHHFATLESPTTNPLVQTILQGLKWLHAKPAQKEEADNCTNPS